MKFITDSFSELGYKWAYRQIDTRSFGLPQRRKRIFLLASKTNLRPQDVLFIDEAHFVEPKNPAAYGFDMHEGTKGLGWVADAIPPIRSQNNLPQVWQVKTGLVGEIDTEDGEALQGFPRGWTKSVSAKSNRKRLIGNSVTVSAAQWIANRIVNPGSFRGKLSVFGKKWTKAGCSDGAIEISEFPLGIPMVPILDFLENPLRPISREGAAGYLERVRGSTELDFSSMTKQEFLAAIGKYEKEECE